MFNAPVEGAGVSTSGGTESILMACLSARQKAFSERGITEPEMYVTFQHITVEELRMFSGSSRQPPTPPSTKRPNTSRSSSTQSPARPPPIAFRYPRCAGSSTPTPSYLSAQRQTTRTASWTRSRPSPASPRPTRSRSTSIAASAPS